MSSEVSKVHSPATSPSVDPAPAEIYKKSRARSCQSFAQPRPVYIPAAQFCSASGDPAIRVYPGIVRYRERKSPRPQMFESACSTPSPFLLGLRESPVLVPPASTRKDIVEACSPYASCRKPDSHSAFLL